MISKTDSSIDLSKSDICDQKVKHAVFACSYVVDILQLHGIGLFHKGQAEGTKFVVLCANSTSPIPNILMLDVCLGSVSESGL